MRRNHFTNGGIVLKNHAVDANLPRHTAPCHGIIVAMIYDIIIFALLQHRMVSGAVYRLVGIGAENGIVVTGSKGPIGIVGIRIAHVVAGVVAGSAGIHQDIFVLMLEHVSCLKRFRCLLQGNIFSVDHAGHALTIEFSHGVAAVVVHPGAPVGVDFSIVVPEKLSIQRRKAPARKAAADYRSVVLMQFSPGSHRRGRNIAVNITSCLTITKIQVIAPVVAFHNIGSPKIPQIDGFQRGYIQSIIVPIQQIATIPQRWRPRCQHLVVGGGINVINTVKLHDGGIGKITGQQRITRIGRLGTQSYLYTRIGLRIRIGLYTSSQQQGCRQCQNDCSRFHIHLD